MPSNKTPNANTDVIVQQHKAAIIIIIDSIIYTNGTNGYSGVVYGLSILGIAFVQS